MWPFRKKAKLDPGNAGFDENPGSFHMVWERKPMPDPGAQNYAWESLGLAPFSAIGPSVRVREGIIPTFGQLYSLFTARMEGIPLTAGGVVGQPLYDPDAPSPGYTKTPNGINMNGPAIALQIPVSYPDSRMTNDTNPTNAKPRL